jgi:hypothetical protein
MIEMTGPRAKVQKEATRQRVPLGGQNTKLQLSELDRKRFEERKMVPRWINDQNGRVQAAEAGGYSFVKPEHCYSIGGDSNVEGDISKVSKVVSRSGDKVVAYLMEIPLKFYNEDQKAKHEQTLKIDEALQATNQGGQTIEGGYTPR